MKIFKEKLKENNIDPENIILNFHTSFCHKNFSKGRPIYTKVDIILNKEKKKIGRYAFTLINKNNFDKSQNNIFRAAEEESGELVNAVNPFVDENLELPEDLINPNFIYINRMYLNKEYRNKGIGAYSFAILYKVLSRKASLITVFPEPYDYDNDQEYDEGVFKKEKENMIKFLKWFDFKQSELNPTIYYVNTDKKLSLLNNK